jgi:hypothetical protein
MGRKSVYTAEQKAEALAIYADHGPSVAAERTGIPKGTIAAWSNRTGTQTKCVVKTREATEARLATIEARHAELVIRLTDVAEAAIAREMDLIASGKLRDVVGAGTRAIHDALLLAGKPTERHATESGSSIDDELVRLAGELDLVPNGPA